MIILTNKHSEIMSQVQSLDKQEEACSRSQSIKNRRSWAKMFRQRPTGRFGGRASQRTV